MLSSINLDDKTYEDFMVEAIAKIPLYSREWTNFNRSDPGITVLQNLAAFQLLQQNTINEVTDGLRRKLLEMAGYQASSAQAATLLLRVPEHTTLTLPAHTPIRVGGIFFENEEALELSDWGLRAVYTGQEGELQNVTYLVEAKGTSAAFGANPMEGSCLYCILHGTPDWGKPVRLWIDATSDKNRNPFPKEGGPVFAKTKWQYFTQQGWQDFTEVSDNTHGLLVDGEVALKIGEAVPAVFEGAPCSGYALRCRLEHAEYDRPPQLHGLTVNLVPVRQWNTRSWCHSFNGAEKIVIRNSLAAHHNIFVYCREQEDEGYRLYTPYTGVAREGRLYLREDLPDGVAVAFHEERFGFGPCSTVDSVLVVCYDDEMVHHRELGMVYGYENQKFDIPEITGLMPDRFSLLCRIPDRNGVDEYHLGLPNGNDLERICYWLDPVFGKLCVQHAGYGMAYELVLGSCCISRGGLGNIRPSSTLECKFSNEDGTKRQLTFFNPGPGLGGVSYESAENLRLRFARDMKKPRTAVLEGDYEQLIRTTPGLAIHKVKAVASCAGNAVSITVKPHSTEEFPMLSPLYIAELERRIEQCRMLTTNVELRQPHYIPVDARAVIYVKGYYAGAMEEIEDTLRQRLDFINGEQGFGSRLRYNEIYHALTALPCVESVDSLRMMPPSGRQGYSIEGTDIKFDDKSLCYPGSFQIELLVRHGQARPGAVL